jgi:hypothetical protein
MRCKRCQSILNAVRTEECATSTQIWYQCPMCWQQQVVSVPLPGACAPWREIPMYVRDGYRLPRQVPC